MTRAPWWKDKARVADSDIAHDIRGAHVHCWNLMKLRGMIPAEFSESSDCKNDSGEWGSLKLNGESNLKALNVFSPTYSLSSDKKLTERLMKTISGPVNMRRFVSTYVSAVFPGRDPSRRPARSLPPLADPAEYPRMPCPWCSSKKFDEKTNQLVSKEVRCYGNIRCFLQPEEDRIFLGAFLTFKPRHVAEFDLDDYPHAGRIASKSLMKGKEAEEQKGYSFFMMEVESKDGVGSGGSTHHAEHK